MPPDPDISGTADALSTARAAEILPNLDLAARRSAISSAARFGITAKLFINFAPTAIYDPRSCLRTTVGLLDELGFAHEDIVFEVIESEHVADFDHLRSILDYYREAGFRVALDDLGAGYASLGMLSELRPDYVKLDMMLTRNVDRDAYKALIAGKLLETAKGLGLLVVAEGVETPGEAAWLTAQGADFLQGYHFARPASPPPALNR